MFPVSLIVYIEEFDKNEEAVLFDFIDSNEYSLLLNLIGISDNSEMPNFNYKHDHNLVVPQHGGKAGR